MSKKTDEILARRKATLNVTFEASRAKHEKRSKELSEQTHKAELILIAWGFLFAGIAGFYQANVFDIHNTPHIVLLLLPMLASVLICVVQVMSRQREQDVPNLSELWTQYTKAYEKDYTEYDDVTAKEQLIQEYIEAEKSNRARLGNKAYWLTLASWLIAIEVVLLIVFVMTTTQPTHPMC